MPYLLDSSQCYCVSPYCTDSLGQTGCPTGWLSFQSKCIIAVEGEVTYSDAMDICENDNNGELLVAEPYSLYQVNKNLTL